MPARPARKCEKPPSGTVDSAPSCAEFLEAVDEVVGRLVRMARHLGTPPGFNPGLGVKRVFMERFPYSVYFIELPTRIRILAFAYARRRPFYWKDRLLK